MNWQVQSLVEALGALRARYAELCRERERERRNLLQKLEAAKDALARHEVDAGIRREELGRQILENERLKEVLARAAHFHEPRAGRLADSLADTGPELGHVNDRELGEAEA